MNGTNIQNHSLMFSEYLHNIQYIDITHLTQQGRLHSLEAEKFQNCICMHSINGHASPVSGVHLG